MIHLQSHKRPGPLLRLRGEELAADVRPIAGPGTLRGDLVELVTMFCEVLATGTYGRLLPHLISAAACDPAFARAQATYTGNRRETVTVVMNRAVARGEALPDLDFAWVQDLIFGPILARHLTSDEPLDPKWAVAHIDRTVPLITDNEHRP